MSYGAEVTRKAVARKLHAMFPLMNTDYDVLAAAIVEAVDFEAAKNIDERELALQKALSSVMEYFNTVTSGLRDELARANAERAKLVLDLASLTALRQQAAMTPPPDPGMPENKNVTADQLRERHEAMLAGDPS